MSLKLTFLGTGGAFTDFRENYHNNAIVHLLGNKVLLLDCGGTGVQSLKELDIPVGNADFVLVTHLHGDHIAGIEQLGWERYYTGPTGPAFAQTLLVAASDVHPGLKSCLAPCVEELVTPLGAYNRGFDFLFTTYTAEPGVELALGGVVTQLHKTPHVRGDEVDKPCYGVVLREHGQDQGGFYYTSDTIFRPDIGDLFPHADVIFHDCTFSPRYPGTVHTHYEELLTLPEAVRNRIVLMHHTKVPEGVSPRQDGFLWAAGRHDSFVLEDNKLTISGPNGGAVYQQEAGRWKRATSIRVG